MTRLTGRHQLAVLWTFGWLVAVGYSVEPIRLKRRGFSNPLALLLVLYVLPIAYGYVALRDDLDWSLLLLLLAIGVQMSALILGNEVEDVWEDQAHRVATPCVRYGVHPVMVGALLLFAAGGVLTMAGFHRRLDLGAPQQLFLVVGSLAQLIVLRDLAALVYASRCGVASGTCEATLAEVRRLGRRSALHFALLGTTVVAGSALSLR
jgi:4-hydroxybenzoate polyprenyltransferase